MAIKFIVFQLVMLSMYPADKLARACIEKTSMSLNPWALNFSSSLQDKTNKPVPDRYKKFHPMPKKTKENKQLKKEGFKKLNKIVKI